MAVVVKDEAPWERLTAAMAGISANFERLGTVAFEPGIVHERTVPAAVIARRRAKAKAARQARSRHRKAAR